MIRNKVFLPNIREENAEFVIFRWTGEFSTLNKGVGVLIVMVCVIKRKVQFWIVSEETPPEISEKKLLEKRFRKEIVLEISKTVDLSFWIIAPFGDSLNVMLEKLQF